MINDNRQAEPGLHKGTKLGPYEILAPIGAGGMGEVYKAKDTRLDRTVAIKVLPSHLAENLDLKQRFEREARAVSSLNHPHICTLYEFDTQDGTDFLVMEYIEGETLAEKLTKGAVPLDKALEYAIQIADGLDKAHRAGIVHRDLKPGNIMLTKLGIKILDFGLAKLQPETAESEDSEEPTRQKPLTDAGSILGTVQYMAPEQLEGKEADARTDIFAFGAVVYEMVTGRRAFEGKSQASLIAAIMEHEPSPMTEVQPLSPPALERAVKKCLAKDPQDRWFSAHDLRDDLKWISERSAEDSAVAPAATSPKLWRRYGVVVALALLLAGLAGWQLKPSPLPGPVMRFAITLPPTQQLTSTGQTAVALSPDGTQLVYIANNHLFLRSLDQMESSPIQGTEMAGQEARGPIFSPDGQWVAFNIDSKLKKILVRGGAPVTLCDLPSPWLTGASWDSEGAIVFADAEKGILRVSADGGVPEVLIPRDPAGALYFRNPQILPGGKSILFTMASRDTRKEAQTVIQTLATGERRVLLEEGDNARYVPPGHLIYALGDTLLAIPFDLESLQVTGGGVPIIENVLRDRFNSAANFNFSNAGSLVYIPASALLEKETLAWIDREGFAVPAMAKLSEAFFPDPFTPRFSPDGKQLAVNHAFEDIWVYDLSRGTRIRLTDEGMNIRPVWSPDGSLIAFSTSRRGKLSLFAKPADGSGETKALSTSGSFMSPNSWSADGRLLAFYDLQGDIGVLPVDGQQEPQTVIATTFFEHSPVFSPDGRWLAYVSNESGQDEVYIQAYPGPGGKWSISTGGGQEPLWSSDGRELYYRNGDRLMVVPIDTRDGIAIGKPRLLFEAPLATGTRGRYFYDVSPDGSMFVIVKRSAESRPAEIHFVLNWFDELKRLAARN